LLFTALEARRENASAPDVRPRSADSSAAAAVYPPLDVPPEVIQTVAPFTPIFAPSNDKQPPVVLQTVPSRPVNDFPRPPAPMAPSPTPFTQPDNLPPPPMADTGRGSPAIIYEAGGPALTPEQAAAAAQSMQPIRATRPANRLALVAQGTLIPAALETAIDSTHPGQVRALVSSDVYDSKAVRVLIPRGSRLYGEYKGDVASGQNRAYVIWTRLVRPDGVTIALDSPAADRLGRTGIKGKVNSHFFERLGNALLQTSIEVGAAAATRGISNGSVVVAIPGAVQSSASQIVTDAPKPTLSVKQGTLISVYVARDLDFSGVEQAR
jgi:type IV secretion system protein VirB10